MYVNESKSLSLFCTQGNALKFYSSVRLDIRRKEVLPGNSGIRSKVKVVKNKIAPPFKIVELDIMFGRGIDTAGCLLDAAVELGVVERRGSYYAYGGKNLAQGRLNAVDYLHENMDIYEEMLKTVRLFIVQGDDATAAKAAAESSDDIDIDTTANMTIEVEDKSVEAFE